VASHERRSGWVSLIREMGELNLFIQTFDFDFIDVIEMTRAIGFSWIFDICTFCGTEIRRLTAVIYSF
jgi:hypothetical protein